MRGEDTRCGEWRISCKETPPRAWGRPSTPTQTDLAWRNTPTCVGKTYRLFHQQLAIEKHPHVRGEDDNPFPRVILNRETPPRAWGRPIFFARMPDPLRNTPTCVGKTAARIARVHQLGKHPHVRGEDIYKRSQRGISRETPPRAWGRHTRKKKKFDTLRNTPTCVGKTLLSGYSRTPSKKHPHVRGEDTAKTSTTRSKWETPPRAWGRHSWRLCLA